VFYVFLDVLHVAGDCTYPYITTPFIALSHYASWALNQRKSKCNY